MDNSDHAPERPRGRPSLSEAEMDETRRRITVCAMRLFQEDGYHAVSMRRLASEVGCTVMTLYRYFDGKIDILRGLWAEVFAELFEGLAALAAREDDPGLRLKAVAMGYLDFWLSRREHYFLVFMSSGVSQSDVSVFVDEDGVVEKFNLLRDCVAAALPGASADEIDLKTQFLLCALNGIAHNLITIGAYPWVDPERLVDEAVSGTITLRDRPLDLTGHRGKG